MCGPQSWASRAGPGLLEGPLGGGPGRALPFTDQRAAGTLWTASPWGRSGSREGLPKSPWRIWLRSIPLWPKEGPLPLNCWSKWPVPRLCGEGRLPEPQSGGGGHCSGKVQVGLQTKHSQTGVAGRSRDQAESVGLRVTTGVRDGRRGSVGLGWPEGEHPETKGG